MRAGRITAIVGPMFAGKSTELLRLYERARRGRRRVFLVKALRDSRWSALRVETHDGDGVVADARVRDAAHLLDVALPWLVSAGERPLVCIDEAQFISQGTHQSPGALADAVRLLARRGADVALALLAIDHRGEPWHGVGPLLCFAHPIICVSAVCSRCGSDDAVHSHRTSGGDALVEVGGAEAYEALCETCFAAATRHLEVGHVVG